MKTAQNAQVFCYEDRNYG